MQKAILRSKRLLFIAKNFWKMERIYRELQKIIDQDDLSALKNRLLVEDWQKSRYARKKYLGFNFRLRQNILRVIYLGLDDSSNQNILDLGCGTGYFLLICRHFGHTVTGLDISGKPIFDELINFFHLPRVDFRISAFTPLPDFDKPFDLITAYYTTFNELGEGKNWGVAEWEYFLDDIDRCLNPGGRFFVHLNFSGATKEVFELFEHREGQIIDQVRVLFQR